MSDEHLRIGDAERERAATALGEHYAQGRITAEEHTERLEQVWAARTRAELQPVFRDLPGPARTPQRAPPDFRPHGFPGPLVVVTPRWPPNAAPIADAMAAISSSAWNVRTPNDLCFDSSWRMSDAGVIG